MISERVLTEDHHTGGEPFRIVPVPPVRIDGATVAERRMSAIGDPDVDRADRNRTGDQGLAGGSPGRPAPVGRTA
ncbi:hypothetical protein JCM9534A_62450 [Catenuloplanes indicus JCM 9534]